MDAIDVRDLKARIDLCDLARHYTTLRPWGRSGELAGPCPQPLCSADEDGFHVHPDGWWKCYSCHPKRADAIAWLLWMRLASDFTAACRWLANWCNSHGQHVPTRQSIPRKPTMVGPGWMDPGWQAMAQRTLNRAVAALAGQSGEPGRAYLTGRGILPEAWRAWRLGYDSARFDPRQGRCRPAIVLPWYGPSGLTALKYRFLDSRSQGDRFGQMRGGQQILFGSHLIGQHHDTLILCEGEMNAISIWQALQGLGSSGVDVISFGSQGGAANAAVLAVARRYRRVILWADETAPVRACLAALGARAFGLKSVVTEDNPSLKLDANELLRCGLLEGLLERALVRFQIPVSAVGYASQTQAGSGPTRQAALRAPYPTSASGVTTDSGRYGESPGEIVRIPLDCLTDYLDLHHLKVVGGDPGLGSQQWQPLLYLAERAAPGCDGN